MKKIVFIVFTLLISLQAYSQSTFKKGIVVGEDQVQRDSLVLDDGRIVPYVDGSRIGMYNDSIAGLNARIAVLEGGRTDVTGPVIDSIIATDYLSFVAHYDETIVADQDDKAYFDVVTNGYYTGFSSMAVTSTTLTFTVDDTIRPGNVIFLEYTAPTSGGVVDVYANEALTSSTSVTNRVPEVSGPIASWGFNSTLWDDSLTYLMTKSAGVEYSLYAAEGTRSANVDGTNHYLHTNDAINLTDDFTIFFTYLSWYQADYPKCLLSNRDSDGGFEVYSNGAEGNIEVRTFNAGGDSVVAKSNYALARGKHNSVGITGDVSGQEIHFWINGVDEDLDTTSIAGFPVNDTIYVGADADNEFIAIGYIDWLRPYNYKLEGVNFRNLHNAINIEPIIDTVAPSPDTAYVSGTSLVMQFNENFANTTLDLGAFTYTEDGGAETISDDYTISGSNITFTVPQPAGGATLVLAYSATGSALLKDAYDNYTAAFSQSVRNDVQSVVTLIAHYPLDSNSDDYSGNDYDALENSINYSTSLYAAGTGSFTAAGSGNTSPILPLDSTFTISAWIYRSSDITYTDYLSQRRENAVNTDGGVELSYDFTNGHPFVSIEDADGNSENINGSTAGTGTSEWIHVVLEVDLWADTLAFWVNGAFVSGNHAITELPVIAKKWNIGRGRSTLDGYLDDVQFYDSLASDANVLFLYENPGDTITGGVDPPCQCGGVPGDCDPCPDLNDFNVYQGINFDHWESDKSLPVMYNIDNWHTQQIESLGGVAAEKMFEYDFLGKSPWRDGDHGVYMYLTEGDNDEVLDGSGLNWYRTYRDSIVYDPLTNSPSLKISQAEGRVNSYYGEAALVNIPEADFDEIYYGYNAMFNPEFEPRRTDYDNAGGGKLLGYGGGNPTDFQPLVLPETVSAGKPYTIGFAGRMMYDSGGFNTYSNYFNNPAYLELRADIANGVPGATVDTPVPPRKIPWSQVQPSGDTCDNGGAVNKPFLYNDGFIPRWDETEPRWYNVTYRLKMNTGTEANGFIEGYINGYLVHYIEGIRWFENSASLQEGFNRIKVAGFMGGNSLNLSAPADSWWIYDDIWWGMPKSGHGNPGIKSGVRNDNNTYLNLPNWPKQ